MEGLFSFLIKHRKTVIMVFLIGTMISMAMIPLVTINFDLAEYLPDKVGTKQAIKVVKEEFSYPGTAQVMAENVTLSQGQMIKEQIKAIEGVRNVIWLDDITDITKPEDFIQEDIMKDYYRDGAALFQVEFDEDNYAESTSAAIEEMERLYPDLSIAGNAQNSRNMKNVLEGEIFQIVAIVLPVCLLILIVASTSWVEPFIYLGVIGVSVAINMGTNALFSSISFITNSMASLLQLAISMDYSIFLMHRYFEERDRGLEPTQAVIRASVETLSSISASALTTIAGFVALVFMRYGIGTDVGLVLAKGILISLVSVIALLPVLIVLFNKAIERTRHRSFLPSFEGMGKAVVKLRFGIIVLALLLVLPSLLAQGRNEFLYGDSSALHGEGKAMVDRQRIIQRFGVNNPIMMLVPKGNWDNEVALNQKLEDLDSVRSVVSLVTLTDNALSPSFIPYEVKKNFESENYSRIIVNLNIDGEIPESFESVEEIRSIAQEYYPDEWLAAGISTSLTDIRDTVTRDSLAVAAISLGAVGVIILLTFKSLSIPLILLLVIQSSVWINMAFPYFTGFKMAYIGYLIISSLQLGATIDYGILLTSRYLEFRSYEDPEGAAMSAVKTAGTSVVVSALILASAGFGFGLVSQVGSISELGILIGRGALISCIMTLLLLPALLMVMDRIVVRDKINAVQGSK